MGKKPTILVLDDDKTIRVLLERHLTGAGFDDTTHEFPEKIMKEAMSDRFDLIVTDIIMDPMSGIEFAEYLRAQGRTVPIILITGRLTPTMTRTANKLGIKEIISKPFKGEDIVDLVRTLLK